MRVLGYFTSLAVASATANRVYLPKPQGPYHVGKTRHIINHTTYNDPVAPQGWNHTGRFFLVSVYYPTEQVPTEETSSKYMDSTLANITETAWNLPSHSLEQLYTSIQWQAPFLSNNPSTDQTPAEKPTILLSPGLGAPCLTYSVLSADLASQGYPVLCIDHPGEPPYLALPGGGGIRGMPALGATNQTYAEAVYDVRVSDMKALLDVYPTLVEELGAPFNSETLLGVGHSFGGATISGVMATEDRILGGVNLDGTFWGDYRHDLKRPFLLMCVSDHNSTSDQTWSGWEDAQSAWWEELEVRGASHYDYMDLPMLFQLLRVEGPPGIAGPIDTYRMRDIVTTFVEAFFDMVLGKDSSLLGGKLPNKEWPEVVRLASNGVRSVG